MNLTDILSKAAPWLAAAAAGPAGLAGMAIKTVAEVLGASTDNAADLAAAVAGATPEQLKALKLAELDFKVRMQELGFKQITDLEGIAAADRASAREREAKTGDTLTPRTLALLVTLGFFGVLAWLLAYGKPDDGGDALLVMLGSLGAAWTAIVAYYFGSSAGSAAKTEILRRGSL